MNLDVTEDLESQPLKFVLVTKLTPTECKARLIARIDSDWIRRMQWVGELPVIGKVKSDRFRIRKRIWYHNSFQQILSGQFTVDGQRTCIYVKLGIHPAVNAFMVIWIGFFAVPIIVEAIDRIRSGQFELASFLQPGLFHSVGMMLFGVMLYFLGYALSRGEVQFLEEFLKKTLLAERP